MIQLPFGSSLKYGSIGSQLPSACTTGVIPASYSSKHIRFKYGHANSSNIAVEINVAEERIAKIAGGVAVLKVGAATEVEMKEKKLRIEDALAATKAAVEEGIVAGGGTALINAIPAVKELSETLTGDEKTGANIVLRALEEPVRQIAANAGLEGSVIIDKIITSGKVNYGFNAQTEVYCDMIEEGIVDPTKVTRSALQNATSVAAMVLTTESLVVDEPEKTPDPAAQGMNPMY